MPVLHRLSGLVVVLCLCGTSGALAQGLTITQMRQLRQRCAPDVKKLCAEVPAGHGAILACMKDHQADLSKDCRDLLVGLRPESPVPSTK